MKWLVNENVADLKNLGELKSLKFSKDFTSNRNAWRKALRMAKRPTRKKCATLAQSRSVNKYTYILQKMGKS